MISASLSPLDSASWAATVSDLERIAKFNLTEVPFPDQATLQELIEAQIAKESIETAVICDFDTTFGAPSLTYRQLNERANQLSHLLRAGGVGPGEIVALMVERSFAMIIGILGIIKAGAAYLPLSPSDPPDRIRFMLRDGNVKTLLVHKQTAGRIHFEGLVVDLDCPDIYNGSKAVSYTHLRAHETPEHLVCHLLLEKKKKN